MSPDLDCCQNKAQMYICTCVHTYIQMCKRLIKIQCLTTQVLTCSQKLLPLQMLPKLGMYCMHVCTGKAFQEAIKNFSTVSVYVVHSVQWKWLIANFGYCILRHSTERPGNTVHRNVHTDVRLYVRTTQLPETQFRIPLRLTQVLIGPQIYTSVSPLWSLIWL